MCLFEMLPTLILYARVKVYSIYVQNNSPSPQPQQYIYVIYMYVQLFWRRNVATNFCKYHFG